jgi:hypothetical protein
MKKLLLVLAGVMTVLPGCDWCCWRKKKCCDKKEMCDKPMRKAKSCCKKGSHSNHSHHDMD